MTTKGKKILSGIVVFIFLIVAAIAIFLKGDIQKIWLNSISDSLFGLASVCEVSQSFMPVIVISDVGTADLSPHSAVIVWNTNVPATSQVEYGLTDQYGQETSLDEELVTTHQVTISGLESLTRYFYRVASTDAHGSVACSFGSDFSLPGDILPTDEDSPATITDLTTQEINRDSITLSWTTPADESGVASYNIGQSQVELSEDNFFSDDVSHTTSIVPEGSGIEGKDQMFEVVHLKPDTKYFFAIKSTDVYGNVSAISNVLAIKTKEIPATTGSSRTGGMRVPVSENEIPAQTSIVSEPISSTPAASSAPFSSPEEQSILGTPSVVENKTLTNIQLLTTDIFFGMRGENVRALQVYLSERGFLATGLITGYFGPLTREAVISFQKRYGVEPSVGYVGPLTRIKMFENW